MANERAKHLVPNVRSVSQSERQTLAHCRSAAIEYIRSVLLLSPVEENPSGYKLLELLDQALGERDDPAAAISGIADFIGRSPNELAWTTDTAMTLVGAGAIEDEGGSLTVHTLPMPKGSHCEIAGEYLAIEHPRFTRPLPALSLLWWPTISIDDVRCHADQDHAITNAMILISEVRSREEVLDPFVVLFPELQWVRNAQHTAKE